MIVNINKSFGRRCWWCGSTKGYLVEATDGCYYCSQECEDNAKHISDDVTTQVMQGKIVSTPPPPYKEPENDLVNHPAHYRKGKFEVIDVIEDWFPDNYHMGSVLKYIARHQYKSNPKQDLEKARWYLDRYIQKMAK